MKPRLVVFTFVAALLALGALAAACGDDELTLEEYFQQVDVLDDESEARFEALEDQFPGGFEEPFEPAAVRGFFDEFAQIFRDFVDGLDDIDPPAAVEDEHNEAVAAGRDLVTLLEDFVDQIAGVETISELEAVSEANEPEIDAAFERLDAACLAVEGIAADNGIVVDLGCEEE